MEYFSWCIFKAKAFIVQHMAYEMLPYECKYFFIVRFFLRSVESALFCAPTEKKNSLELLAIRWNS